MFVLSYIIEIIYFMGLDYIICKSRLYNPIIYYFDAYFKLFMTKDLLPLFFLYEIIHQCHWVSHLHQNSYVVFACIKKQYKL
jgi:hypothetical protein